MTILNSILNRCNEIIKEGEDLLDNPGAEEKQYQRIMNLTTSIENIYKLSFSQGIPRHLSLDGLKDTLIAHGITPHLLYPIGIFSLRLESFKGFRKDLENGLITTSLMNILSLDIYSDMIKQAEELRKHNTESLNRAACVLARIVLEDTLKKLCSRNNIQLKRDKANEANTELKKNNIYSNAQFKLVDAWLAIGNSAAHPKSTKLNFQTITENQIDDMIKNVNDFANKFLI